MNACLTQPSAELQNHRILVIDDNRAIHEDFRKILCPVQTDLASLDDAEADLFGPNPDAPTPSTHSGFVLDSAYQGQEGLEMVQRALQGGQPYALAFVDVRMPPGWDGIETIVRIWQQYPELQVVICTAYSDYSWQDIIKRLGRSDSLVILKKPFDNAEVLQLAHALTEKWLLGRQARCRLEELRRMVEERTRELQTTNQQLLVEITERKHVEEALRVSHERFAKAFRASPLPMTIQTLHDARFVDVNGAFLKTTGFLAGDVVGRSDSELNLWAESNTWDKVRAEMMDSGSLRNLECGLFTKDRQLRHVLLSAELFHLEGQPHVLAIAEDISMRLDLEKKLRRAQKMEAVGQLAAGVAHDFNNVLTVIQGHASLLQRASQQQDKVAHSLAQVVDATDRAARLTRQLLAFSSKQVVQPKVLNLNNVASQLQAMLTRVIGESIALECDWTQDLPPIEADESNIEQVIMNLVVNARDAMPNGGKLILRTSTAAIDEARAAQNPEARPGNFVCLSVIDQGCGMDAATLAKIFEPFFTTKAVGKGTGLGLATVYGIVKQHGGWMEVASTVGQGSTFTVFLPQSGKAQTIAFEQQPATSPESHGGRERILVVEDEEPLRELVREVLQQHGYSVTEAADGVTALQLWEQHQQPFDLLVTDIVMPNGLSGWQLAERLRKDDDRPRIIFTSGYSAEMLKEDFILREGSVFLQKPYKPDQLLRAVWDCLNQSTQALQALA